MFPCICQALYTRHSWWFLHCAFLEILTLNQHPRQNWQLTPAFMKSGNSCFFNQVSLNWETVTTWVHRHDRQRYWTSLVYVSKCRIEMRTCGSGKARCQEKATQPTHVSYSEGICFTQASQAGFLMRFNWWGRDPLEVETLPSSSLTSQTFTLFLTFLSQKMDD